MTVVGEAWVRIRADGKTFPAETKAAVAPGLAATEAEARASGMRGGEAYAAGMGAGTRTAATEVERGGASMTKSMAETEAATGRFSVFHKAKMGEVGKSFLEPLGAAKMLGVGVGGAAVALGVVAGVSVKAASDFQELTTQLVTGAGESTKNISMVRKGLLDMAGQVGVSANELAKGMYNVESAGFHGAAGLNVLKIAAEGAKVGGADMATVTDAITTSLNAYHEPASLAAANTNMLISAVAHGKTHLQDLAGSLGQIVPIASNLHIPLSQVLGAMSTMTMQGTNAAKAATAVRFMLSSLAAPSIKASGAMQDVGLSVAKVGKTLTEPGGGMLDALKLVTDAVGKKFPVGSSAYIGALSDIVGGTRGMTAALELSGQNQKTFLKNTIAIGTAATHTKEGVQGWKEVQGDFSTQMSRLGAAIGAVAIKLGTLLLPWLTKATKAMADGATWVGAHLSPALHALGSIIGSVFSGGNKGKVDGMGRTFQQLGKVGQEVGKVLAAVWHGVTATLSTAWHGIVAVVGTVVHTVQNYLASHQAGVHKTMTTIQTILHTLAGIWTAFFDIIKRIISIATNWIIDLWNRFGKQLLAHIHTAFNAILEVIRGVFEVIKGVFDVVLGILTGKWSRAWNGIKEIVGGVWHVISGVVKAAINTVSTVIGGAMAEISAAWAHVWNGIKDVVGGVWGSIRGFVVSGVNDVIGVINTFIGLLDHLPGVNIGKIGTIGGGGGGHVSSSSFGSGRNVGGGHTAMARGGVLPGYAPGHDTMAVMASPGEGFIVPEAVVGMGGPAAIDAINHHYAGHRGAGTGGAGRRAFSLGGVLSGVGHFFQSAFDIITDPGKAISGLLGHLVGGGASLFKGLASSVLHSIVSGAMGLFGAGGGGGGGGGGAGVQRLAGVVHQVLAMLGQPQSLTSAVLSLISHESGGNSTAVNRSDINWQHGTPSVGDAQVIGPTFAAWAGPFRNVGPFMYGVSTNDLANVYAGMNYGVHTYGSIANIPGIASLASGGGYRPYDVGGWLPPGLTAAVNATGRREAIMPEDVMMSAIRRSNNPAELLDAVDEQTNYLAAIRDLLAGGAGGYHGVTA